MEYKIDNNNVIVNKDDFLEENEIQYINFVLGYDLLNNMFKKSKYPECDTSYNFCDKLSREFVKSEEYQNTNQSTYEMLVEWLNNNKVRIKKDYKNYVLDTEVEQEELER